METFSALLAICAGNSPVPGEFPTQRPVTRSFDVYFDLRPNKRLSKQSWGWWFETLLCSLWRHRNVIDILLQFLQYHVILCRVITALDQSVQMLWDMLYVRPTSLWPYREFRYVYGIHLRVKLGSGERSDAVTIGTVIVILHVHPGYWICPRHLWHSSKDRVFARHGTDDPYLLDVPGTSESKVRSWSSKGKYSLWFSSKKCTNVYDHYESIIRKVDPTNTWCSVLTYFTHILQGYSIGTRAIMYL